jgi:hypothetical protein
MIPSAVGERQMFPRQTKQTATDGAAKSVIVPGVYNSDVAGPRLLDLNAEIDRLYQRALAEFVSERNALAARVKAEQGKDAAHHIKTLEKPNLTAWIVNQLYWRARTDFTALLLAGDAVRLVQQQRLGGADVDAAPALRSRQAAMDALLAQAADLIKEAGHTPSPELRQRLMSTLDALATYGTGEAGPRAGRLTREVASPGFDALATLLPAATTAAAPSSTSPFAKSGPPKFTVVSRRAREKAEAALAAAEAALAGATAHEQTAREALGSAEAAWQAARRNVAEQQRLLDQAADAEARALHERDERKRDASRAALAVRDAQRTLDAATRAMKD